MATTTPAAPAKSRIGLFITLGVILVIFLGARGTYNGMVTADETANEKWNNVESAYQRRLDLIDNLVNTVKGAADFELLKVYDQHSGSRSSDPYLYEKVITTIAGWGNTSNLMFVTGATQAAELAAIRKIIPDHFLLVPGVGFQGGSLDEVSLHGMNNDIGLLVNASRAIIYAGAEENFAEEAKVIATQYQAEMKMYIHRFKL